MKIKTSITLSEDLLKGIDALSGAGRNRSALMEEALRFFLRKKVADLRDRRDLQILNQKSASLNREAEDVLSYQVEL
jgi:metal-responsive CopG/Arc/MetJ family transcriptional regulator